MLSAIFPLPLAPSLSPSLFHSLRFPSCLSQPSPLPSSPPPHTHTHSAFLSTAPPLFPPLPTTRSPITVGQVNSVLFRRPQVYFLVWPGATRSTTQNKKKTVRHTRLSTDPQSILNVNEFYSILAGGMQVLWDIILYAYKCQSYI